MKEHLVKLATALATHHVAMAAAAKDGMDVCDEGSDEAESFRKLIESHATAADACTRCAKALTETESQKADGGDGLDKIVPAPPGFSAVHDTPSIRMIPRAGGAPVRTTNAGEFEFLTRIEGGE